MKFNTVKCKIMPLITLSTSTVQRPAGKEVALQQRTRILGDKHADLSSVLAAEKKNNDIIGFTRKKTSQGDVLSVWHL